MKKVRSTEAAAIALLVGILTVACGADLSGTATDSTPEMAVAPVESVIVLAADGSDLGRLALEVNCGATADMHLLRGMSLYHNMTFWEAKAEFTEATAAEPGCAIGYWGAALSFVHPIWPDTVSDADVVVGRELLDQARAAAIRSDRADTYIHALSGYYEDAESRSELERLQTLRDRWEGVHNADPSDIEATALHALTLLGAATPDPTFPDQNRAGALLASILAAIPEHPGGMHYTIHAYDFAPLADRALGVANIYGKTISGNSHALHMTSHIFTQVGMWPESIDYNRRAADVALAEPVAGRISHQYLHALDYLAYAYLQQGNDEAAMAVWGEVPLVDQAFDHAATSYAIAAIPVRYALERREWGEAAAAGATIDASAYPAYAAITTFAAGMGAAHNGNNDEARVQLARLAELRDAARLINEPYDWAAQVEIQRLTLQSWIEYGTGDTDAALATAASAADLETANPKHPVTPGMVLPAREAYADMLFALERYDEAAAQYAATLETNPNRYRSLLGAGDSARLAGNADAARGFYGELLEVATGSERPELARVREHLAN